MWRRLAFEDLAVTSYTSGTTGLPEGTVLANGDARALASLTDRATRPERAVPADERSVLELVAVLAVGRDADPSLAYRAAARSFIEAHLSDPGLTASRVAAAIGVSERHLSRVFAVGGTSIPRYVLSRRLQLGMRS